MFAAIAQSLSAVAGALRAGAVPTLRRMPRMVALTASDVGRGLVTGKLVGVQDCCHAAANGRGLDTASGFDRQKGRDRFRSGRERRHTPVQHTTRRTSRSRSRRPAGWLSTCRLAHRPWPRPSQAAGTAGRAAGAEGVRAVPMVMV